MDKFLFGHQIKRLYSAFNRRYNDDQASIYFEALITISNERFTRIIDLILINETSFPAIATVLNYRSSVPETQPGYVTAQCHRCEGTGHVVANRDGYKYAFRCSDCQNWRGKYESYPLWSAAFYHAGYRLDAN